MSIRLWRKAAQHIKDNYVSGSLSDPGSGKDGAYGHCALGTIGFVTIPQYDHKVRIDDGYGVLKTNEMSAKMVKELAEELARTVPRKNFITMTGSRPEDVLEGRCSVGDLHHVVFMCNDTSGGKGRISKAMDSIVAKREAKLEKRRQAKLRRELEKQEAEDAKRAQMKIKNLKVEYMPAGLQEEKVTHSVK